MLRINEKFHGFKVKAIGFPGGMPKFEEKRRFPGEKCEIARRSIMVKLTANPERST